MGIVIKGDEAYNKLIENLPNARDFMKINIIWKFKNIYLY